MLSIQELVDKTEVQRRQIREFMDGYATFHPADASLLSNQKPADRQEILDTLHYTSLKEFLAKSGTTGIAGAAYCVPDKLHADLLAFVQETDKVPLIGSVVNGWQGGDLKVQIESTTSASAATTGPIYSGYPSRMASGAQPATDTTAFATATISPLTFGRNIRITEDLLDDAAYELMTWHVQNAAKMIGKMATSLAVQVLVAGGDGAGTLNTVTSDAGEVKWRNSAAKDVVSAIGNNALDGWLSDTMVTNGDSYMHSIAGGALTPFFMPTKPGYYSCIENIDVIVHWNAVDLYTGSKQQAVVFDRNNALLTGRKRWMKIENYGDPVKDIAGAWVSCRQDSITLHKDAICVITEA